MLGRLLTISLISFSFTNSASAEIGGYIASETRAFWESEKFDLLGQKQGTQTAIIIEPELIDEFNDGKDHVKFTPYIRLDSLDSERSYFDFRELYWQTEQDNLDLLLGFSSVYWGVAESRHLVDVINTKDSRVDIDEEDKLGQLMARFRYHTDYGSIEAILMPYFREAEFVGKKSRLRLPVEIDDAIYEDSDEERHLDFAARYSHSFSDYDIGIHYFHGTTRDPLFVATSLTTAAPFYQIIDQVGIDFQATYDAILLKFEGIYRKGQGYGDQEFFASVAGFEYSFYNVSDSNIDIGLLAEYQFQEDNYLPAGIKPLANNDLFLGTRLTFNDTQDTAILAGGIIDLDDKSTSLLLEAERRIGDNIKIEATARFFTNIDTLNPLFAFEKDDHFILNIAYYF